MPKPLSVSLVTFGVHRSGSHWLAASPAVCSQVFESGLGEHLAVDLGSHCWETQLLSELLDFSLWQCHVIWHAWDLGTLGPGNGSEYQPSKWIVDDCWISIYWPCTLVPPIWSRFSVSECFRIPLQKCQASASLNILYTLINTLEIHWAILSL